MQTRRVTYVRKAGERTERIAVRLTKAEKAKFTRLCEKHGRTTTEQVVAMIEAGK